MQYIEPFTWKSERRFQVERLMFQGHLPEVQGLSLPAAALDELYSWQHCLCSEGALAPVEPALCGAHASGKNIKSL